MGQVLKPDNIAPLVKASSTTATLASSLIKIGGQQYSSSNLTLDITTVGAGGLDSGSLLANKLYYVYAVLSAGNVALVATLTKNAPSGFTAIAEVGRLVSESTPVINYVYALNQKQFESGPARTSNGSYTGGSGFQPLTVGNPNIDFVAKESGTFRFVAKVSLTNNTASTAVATARINCFAGGTPTNVIDQRGFYARPAVATNTMSIQLRPEFICDLQEGIFYQFQYEVNSSTNMNGDLTDPGGVEAMTAEKIN